MKKHNERNAGRKPIGDTAKIHKTLRIDPELFELVTKNFESFSQGIDEILRKHFKKIKIN